ncbi:MAG: glycosyltransferase family 4 protein [Paludibacteraceae bacterium]|nr:glycosyltransferase family 4 protein [Paludibacteraceae bacterium]
MIIAFDAKRAFHNYRGLGNYSRDYMRLATIYAPDNRYLLFNPRHSGLNLMPQLGPSEQEVLPNGLWRFVPAAWRTFGCTQQICKLHADIYHGLSAELPLGIPHNIRQVVTVHDAIFIRYPELYSFTYRNIFRQKVLYACRKADIIVAISEQTKQDCIRFFGADEKKIKVIYQGCSNIFRKQKTLTEIENVRRKYSLPDQFLLDVGAIEPRKNLKNLLLAMSIAKTSMPLVVIGGTSKYAMQMKQMAAELKLNAMFLHNVLFADMPAIYRAAHALIYPSLFEGFGIPILEGLCSGIPVLTSTGSCFAETGGDAVLYADPLNPHDIAEKLATVISDENMRSTLRQKAAIQADKFADSVVGENIRQLYLSLC